MEFENTYNNIDEILETLRGGDENESYIDEENFDWDLYEFTINKMDK